MKFTELFLIAIGLSMDAFAVSLCKGLQMKKLNYRHMIVIALFFGGFQAIMPFIGWFLGKQFESYITQFDHWIAFGLLLFLGVKMIVESCKKEEEQICGGEKLNIKEVLVLAIATSIDALAVGITFAFLKVQIVPSVLLIGSITFVLSAIGVVIGNRFGSHFKKKAGILGGLILILIGVKILLSHLGILV